MKPSILDSKLKSLIQICKETENYRKLAVVSFILTSNLLDEIGIKLGIRPRKINSNEKIFDYMKLINQVIQNNIQVVLFKDELINTLRSIELIFLKKEGDIPFQYIKTMFTIYYDLRKLDIPNLHENIKDMDVIEPSDTKLFSFLSPQKRSKRNPDSLKSLILNNLREKELTIRRDLNKNFNKNLFEKAFHLKGLRSAIKTQGNDKIKISGRLKDNINYQTSLDEITSYLFIGAFLLFFLLGFIVIIEAIIYPFLTGSLSVLILMFIGPGILFFLVYWNYFHEEGR